VKRSWHLPRYKGSNPAFNVTDLAKFVKVRYEKRRHFGGIELTLERMHFGRAHELVGHLRFDAPSKLGSIWLRVSPHI